MEYSNLHQVLHIELDKKIGGELVDKMIEKFNVDDSFKNFVDVYKTLKFADDTSKREYIKTTLKMTFGSFFRSYQGEHYEESCEFVNSVCKIFFQYVSEVDSLHE
jgi:hypothetical protein